MAIDISPCLCVSVAHPAVTGGLTLDYNTTGSYEGWDRFGRVVDQRWTNGAGTTDLDRYTYTYDYNSNRTSRDNALNSVLDEDYTYDAMDRLVDTNRNGVDLQSWNLDSLGNWNGFTNGATTENRTFNGGNEILSSSTAINPVFDEAGNMIEAARPDDPAARQHYKYDAWNRLVKASDDNAGNPGNAIAEFEYDGRNYRIQKTAGGVIQAFYRNEGNQVLEIRKDGDVDPSEQYIWDLRYIDSPVVRFHDANTDGDYADAGDSILYYANDANMNVTALIDAATGNVVERYHYDPYGKVNIFNGLWVPTTTSAFGNSYLYTGRYLDVETDLYYYRARFYDAQLGRFISKDPIGFAGSPWNLYAYVRGRPTIAVDPKGLEPSLTDQEWEEIYSLAQEQMESQTSGTAQMTPEINSQPYFPQGSFPTWSLATEEERNGVRANGVCACVPRFGPFPKGPPVLRIPAIPGSDRDMLLKKSKEFGVEGEIIEMLNAADNVGSGWGESIYELINLRPDRNDQGLGGACGESAEAIFEHRPVGAFNVTVSIAGMGSGYNLPGNPVHNWVQVVFTNDGGIKSFTIDNGSIGGADKVGQWDDLLEFYNE